MTRETLIPKSELEYQTKHYIDITYGSDYCNNLFNKPRKEWDEEEKIRYRNARSCTYCRLRSQLKTKAAKMWTNTLTAGNLKPWLSRHGINTYDGSNYSCRKLADSLIKYYIQNTVIPAMEKELNITGVKMTKNTSANCMNCLDFSRAKVKEDKE